MVTATQIELVQASWAQVAPIGPQAASMFYNRLFEIDPGLRALFHGDMVEQGSRLVGMIDVAVRGLSDLDALIPAVEALGLRHAGYGVLDQDYVSVGAALLWTLARGLGEAFTIEVGDAWNAVYTLLTDTMKTAVMRGELVAIGS